MERDDVDVRVGFKPGPMYETLLNLPLFKGASPDVITDFLLKTRVAVHRFAPGQIIVKAGSPCRKALCVVSGGIVTRFTPPGCEFTVSQTLAGILMPDAICLFGIETRHALTIVADTQCGVMEFSKSSLLAALRDNEVCLFNWLNLQAYEAQRLGRAMAYCQSSASQSHPLSRLNNILQAYTDRRASSVTIRSVEHKKPLSNVLWPMAPHKDIQPLISLGLLSMPDDFTVTIPDRRALADHLNALTHNQINP